MRLEMPLCLTRRNLVVEVFALHLWCRFRGLVAREADLVGLNKRTIALS